MTATERKRITNAAHANATSLAKQFGLKDGESIVVEYSNPTGCPQPTVAYCGDGRISIGGCICSPGMIGKAMSKPFKFHHQDMKSNYVGGSLADGTVIEVFKLPGEGTVRYRANGKEYRTVMALVLELTPVARTVSTTA